MSLKREAEHNMKIETEMLQRKNSNPVISVAEDGIILYSNKAAETLLREWRVGVGEKVPFDIGNFVKMAISRNSPINIEVNVGKKLYLTTFYHFPEDNCINIYGFDTSDQKLLDEKVQESEIKEVANLELIELIDIQASTSLSAGIPPGEFKLFRCKNNMWNMVTPIFVGGHHGGNIFPGQLFFDDDPLNYDFFRSQARKYGFNEEEYVSALEKVPRMSRESVKTDISYLMRLASMFSQLSYSNTMLIQSLAERDALADALKESEKREKASSAELAVVLDAVPASVMIAHDPRALKMTGNRLSYEWIRLPEGTNISKAVPEGKRLETHKLFKNGAEIPLADMPVRMAASGMDVRDYEFDVVYPDGMMRHVLGNFRSLRDEQGNPQGAVAAIIDITERKKAEDALRKSEERYRMLFTNMTEAFFLADIIYSEDGKPFDFRFLEINPAFELQTGKKREKILGKSFLDVSANTNLTDTDNFLEVALSGKSTSFEMFSPATGKYFEVYAFSPEKGKLAAILKNITDRKQIEESLYKNEEKYRNIVETSNEGISLNDGKGLLTYTNQKMAEMLGYDISEIIGRNILDFVEDIDDSVVTNSIQRQLQDNIQSYDFKLLRKDRSPLWVFVNIKSFLDEDGKFIGSLNMFTDVTERKNAEMKLKETLDNLENLVKERTSELETAYNFLKEGEKSLAEAQRMAHIGNWDWNLVTNQIYFSEELYRIFGLEPQTVVKRYESFLTHYVHPDDCDYVNSAVEKALKGEPSIFQNRIITATGDERIIYSQTETILDEKNRPIRVKAIVQDVTERKKSEERIRNLANIVESSNDAIGTISPEGTITSWNKGAEDVYGYSQEEIVGKHISVLAPSHLSDEIKKRCEQVKRGESIRQYETLRLRKGGKIINVSITLSPVFDSHGKMTDISFISRDITEKTRAEGKLRESEEKYRNIVETANEGIVKTDSESVITYVNLKMVDMLGYTIEELIGKTIWGFISDEYKPIIKMNLEKRKNGISESIELKLIHKSGSHLWTHMNSKPLFDKESGYIGAVSLLTDITLRKEAEQALANFEIVREKEIHHRIKNNLQVVSSLLDFHAFKFKGRNDIKDSEVIDSFRESKNRVISMALIHEELYKGSGTETINFSTYVEKLANNLLSIYKLGNTDINLIEDIDEDLFLDMDTAIPLGTIINELVSNSFKHAFTGREKGEVRIMLHREEEKRKYIKDINEDNKNSTFILTISDDGIGIPQNLDIQELDSLGLQLVTTLVNKLGGELELKSKNGTEFVIRFKVTKKEN